MFSVLFFTQLAASLSMQPTYIPFQFAKEKHVVNTMALQVFDGATPRERLMKRRYTAQFGGRLFRHPSKRSCLFDIQLGRDG